MTLKCILSAGLAALALSNASAQQSSGVTGTVDTRIGKIDLLMACQRTRKSSRKSTTNSIFSAPPRLTSGRYRL
jgi:hypothetical protein